jgi:hypothetical protein
MAGQCLAGLDNVRLEISVCGWLWVARLDYFHFIHYTPLNSMVFLYSRNIKTSSTWACINIEPYHFTSFWLHEDCHFWSCFGIDFLDVVTWSTSHHMINFHFWSPCHFIFWFNRDWYLVICDSSWLAWFLGLNIHLPFSITFGTSTSRLSLALLRCMVHHGQVLLNRSSTYHLVSHIISCFP